MAIYAKQIRLSSASANQSRFNDVNKLVYIIDDRI